jgi:excisionase family DNA binding protein
MTIIETGRHGPNLIQLLRVAFMINKRNLKHRRSEDRRKNPDRRNGYDRRTLAGLDFGDNGAIFTTQEACLYLKVSRPTYLKYITAGKIKAQKIGRGWKVIKDELDRFIRGE